MMVYQVPSSRVLASFSYYKRECWNSDYFVSCVIDEADSRLSRLAILVADLPEGSSRAYGCNVSTMAPGGVLRVLSWRVDVVHPWSKLRSPWWGIQVPAPTPYRPSSGLSITCFWGIFLFSRLSMYLEFFSALWVVHKDASRSLHLHFSIFFSFFCVCFYKLWRSASAAGKWIHPVQRGWVNEFRFWFRYFLEHNMFYFCDYLVEIWSYLLPLC